MSLPSEILAERSNASDFIPLLPAKAYITPSPAQGPTGSNKPLIHAHVGLGAMPAEDKIKDVSTKATSSSASAASSLASSNQDGKMGFRPLADLKG